MKPYTYNFTIQQGETFRRTFINESEELDLADYESVRMQIRSRPQDQTIIWDSEVDGLLELQADRIVLIISAELTAAFNFTTAGYDIELVKADGTVEKLARGAISLVREYTKVQEISA